CAHGPDCASPVLFSLSLHDALPILVGEGGQGSEEEKETDRPGQVGPGEPGALLLGHRLEPGKVLAQRLPFGRALGDQGPYGQGRDRKSTRLNSSHVKISYAVSCLKK